MSVTVREAFCHPETCLEIEGPDDHVANVNPIQFSDDKWRVDCDRCFTCIRSNLSKPEALEAAKKHVLTDPEEYFKSLTF